MNTMISYILFTQTPINRTVFYQLARWVRRGHWGPPTLEAASLAERVKPVQSLHTFD